MEQFRDRREAGARLGRALSAYAGRDDVVVLGLPRGGVAIAYEIAVALRAPLDVLVVRNLGIPGYDEVAMGALASGGIQVIDGQIVMQLGISAPELRVLVDRGMRELELRERALRGRHAPLDVAGKTAIIADEGLAHPTTMVAAVTSVRIAGAEQIVVAAPVGAPAVLQALHAHVDDLQCLIAPDELESVGDWYEELSQLTDDDVRGLLSMRGAHGVYPPSDHRHRDPSARRS